MKKETKKENGRISSEVKRANLSFLQLIFPSLLLIIIPENIGKSILYSLFLKILIFGYQYFLIKNFVDSVYN